MPVVDRVSSSFEWPDTARSELEALVGSHRS